jgi:serine/threonine-protein kinase
MARMLRHPVPVAEAEGPAAERMLLEAAETSLEIEPLLQRAGSIFRRFDGQDSGNVSYGVRAGERLLFVKTAGPRGGPRSDDRRDRVAALRRVAALHRRLTHPALPALRNLIETPGGPALVLEWASGELLYAPRPQREDPRSAHARFRALAPERIARALDTVFELHRVLADGGVVASDFYDGSLIYDFASGALHVCDLDEYRDAPFRLERDRNFGSERFMAPEEFRRGERIDQRTNVFTLGRTALVFLAGGSPDRARFQGPAALHAVAARACEPARERRYADVAAFARAWREARAIPERASPSTAAPPEA